MAVLSTGTISSNSSTTAVEVGTVGEYFVGVTGTFGDGTVTTELSENGTTWITIGSPAVFTAAGWAKFSAPKRAQVRLTLSGATSPSLTYFISE